MAGSIQMEMILMVPVGVWSQDGTERAAGITVHLAQNCPTLATSPTAKDRDFLPVGQSDPGNINGITLTMLRNTRARPVVTRPARVGCNDPD
jgi:hypothetical protein